MCERKVEIAFNRGYRVGRDGTPHGISVEVLCAPPDNLGYRCFTLHTGETAKRIKVHRLQAYQKFGQDMFREGNQVRHLNGDKLDNSWDNITIGTAADNTMDIPADIRHARAVQGGRARSHLSVEDVQEIRRLHREGWKYADLMTKFGIANSTVSYIICRKTWRDV